jgi:hypothetical protein
MKKWIGFITAIACCLSSTLPADGGPSVEDPQEEILGTSTTETPPIADESLPDPEPERKNVGVASEDGSQTASNWGKYLLAGGMIAAGIIALILVSRNSGHHRH